MAGNSFNVTNPGPALAANASSSTATAAATGTGTAATETGTGASQTVVPGGGAVLRPGTALVGGLVGVGVLMMGL